MDISEIKERKAQLAADITDLLDEFEQETGTVVESIDFGHTPYISDEGTGKVRHDVEIEVGL